jgi:hypothetical protein
MVLYQICVFGAEILKIFLSETTKPIGRFLNIFPIGSYVKTMSADGGHLGWRYGSLDIVLKVDNLRTIHLKIFLSETTKPIEL